MDSLEAAFSGLAFEMAAASSKYFEVEPFDDVGMTPEQTIAKYLEQIFWTHSKALAAWKGRNINLDPQNLKNAGSIPVIAMQLTEETYNG